jgi:hypothetical protein
VRVLVGFGLFVLLVLLASHPTHAAQRKLISDSRGYFHVCPVSAQGCLDSVKVNGKAYYFDTAQTETARQISQSLDTYRKFQMRRTVPLKVTGFVRNVPDYMGYGPADIFQITAIEGMLVPAQ